MEDGRTPELRRMMVEYGEQFWRSGWAPLYGVLGGNPLAAMPSLHFATSVTAAHVLTETGASPGRSAGRTRRMLGVALVYLGEHYVVDLTAGLALAEGVRARRPAGAPARAARVARGAGDRGAGARMSDGLRHAGPVGETGRAAGVDDQRRAAAAAAAHAAQPRSRSSASCRLARRALLPAAAARGPAGHVAPDRGRQPVVDAARAAFTSACSPAT